jgi:intracellular sulfur oxidation DsrE/DsrF family protein
MLGMNEQRRNLFTRAQMGMAAVAAVALSGVAKAQTKLPFVAARHDKDDWFDEKPAKHRLVLDSTQPAGLGDALLFANNYLTVNKADYGLKDSDLGIVIVVRHVTTIHAFNDAMFAKYTAPLADGVDLKGKEAPKVNTYRARAFGSMDALSKQGVQYAVCSMATRRIAGTIARATGGNTDAIFTELTMNLVDGARMVPAGIVAVSRAQERGYTLVSA